MKNLSSAPQTPRKQGGFIMVSEMLLLVTVMVIGMIVGLVTMRDAVTAEMEDVAEAIGQLDQSYAFDGLVNAELTARVEGSSFGDSTDTNAGDEAVFSYVAADGVEGTTTVTASTGGESPLAAGSQ